MTKHEQRAAGRHADLELSGGSSFEEAVPVEAYLDDLDRAAAKLGFERSNTMAIVSTCREPQVGRFRQLVDDRWGPIFDMGGLAGLPSTGRSEWASALAHRPDERTGGFLIVGMAHIGVAVSATSSERPTSARACLAVHDVLSAIRPIAAPGDSLEDYEAQRLNQLLASEVGWADSVEAATKGLVRVIEDELVRALGREAPWRSAPVLIATGALVHRPGTSDLVWPGRAVHIDHEGRRRGLEPRLGAGHS